MQHLLFWIVGAFAGYFCGSLSSAVIVCRAMGYGDPRTLGSMNPGATNVLRIAGEKAAALTLAGDSLKGFLPVIVFKYVLYPMFPASIDNLTIMLVGLGAFFGHLYPFFFVSEGARALQRLSGYCSAGRRWWHCFLPVFGGRYSGIRRFLRFRL